MSECKLISHYNTEFLQFREYDISVFPATSSCVPHLKNMLVLHRSDLYLGIFHIFKLWHIIRLKYKYKAAVLFQQIQGYVVNFVVR
jgi:hypothetical protein